jgi:hypothetical protein
MVYIRIERSETTIERLSAAPSGKLSNPAEAELTPPAGCRTVAIFKGAVFDFFGRPHSRSARRKTLEISKLQLGRRTLRKIPFRSPPVARQVDHIRSHRKKQAYPREPACWFERVRQQPANQQNRSG